jgi:hypothetical protein
MTIPGSSEEDDTVISALLNLPRNLLALYGFSEWKHHDLNARRNDPIDGLYYRPWRRYAVWPYHFRYEQA